MNGKMTTYHTFMIIHHNFLNQRILSYIIKKERRGFMLGSKKISTYLVETAAKNDENVAAKKKLYLYCLDFLMEQFFFLLSLFLLGWVLHDIPFSLLYFAIFLTYRSTGGGFHANSAWLCTLLSYLMFFLVWLVIESPIALWGGALHPFHLVAYIILVSLFSLLPVTTHKNITRTAEQKKRLKKKQRICLIFFSLLALIFYCTKLEKYYKLIVVCTLILMITQFTGRIAIKKKDGFT